MENLKILHTELCKRVEYLNTQPDNTIRNARINEVTKVIVRLGELILKDIK